MRIRSFQFLRNSILVLLLAMAFHPLSALSTTGSIYGTAVDGTGAAVQEATVLLKETLPQVFEWARAMHPEQDYPDQSEQSDVISFHDYRWPDGFERRIAKLRRLHRPLICTEYIGRGNGGPFDAILPIAKRERVAAINWRFIAGKTQTYYPWVSWKRHYGQLQPTIWFREVFQHNGTPYRQREVDLMRQRTGRGTPVQASATVQQESIEN